MSKKAEIGDIVVRTKKKLWQGGARLGRIIQINGYDTYDNGYYYNNYTCLAKDHYRFATDKEINAYKSGVRNIYDIKIIIDNFSVI